MLTTLILLSGLGLADSGEDMSIIGGSPTEDFAAVGTIVALDEEGYILGDFCSATLIKDDWIVTASHCVELFPTLMDQGAAGFAFIIGTTLYEPDGIWDYGFIIDGAMHPEYNTDTLDNDIAVLQLDAGITTTSPMPVGMSTPSDNNSVTYVGWGKTDENDDYSTGVKQTVTVPVAEVTEAHVITYDPSGRNICNGDSGGAALMPDSSGSYTLVGVNSFGFDVYGRAPHCGGDGAAGGAIRADVYVDWMESVMGEELSEVIEGTEGTEGTEVPAEGPGQQESNGTNQAGGSIHVDAKRTCSTTPMQGSLSLALLGLLGLIRRRR